MVISTPVRVPPFIPHILMFPAAAAAWFTPCQCAGTRSKSGTVELLYRVPVLPANSATTLRWFVTQVHTPALLLDLITNHGRQ